MRRPVSCESLLAASPKMSATKCAKAKIFVKAVARAKSVLLNDGYWQEAAGLDNGVATSQPGDHVAGYIAAKLSNFDSYKATSPSDWNETELAVCLRAADKEPLANAAIRLAIVSALKHGLTLTPELVSFVSLALISAERPKFHHRSKPDSPARAHLIRWAVHCVIDSYHLKATRNETSPPYSACDAVVEALTKIDPENSLNYDNVRKLWDKREKLLAERDKQGIFLPSNMWPENVG